MSEKRVKIEECPKCKAGTSEVWQSELEDALGCISCETCGTLLYPQSEAKKLTKKADGIIRAVIKSTAKKIKSMSQPVVCTNEHIEEDGFCTQCGMNHLGGERPEHPQGGPTVEIGKKAPKVDKSVVRHTHVHLWWYDW